MINHLIWFLINSSLSEIVPNPLLNFCIKNQILQKKNILFLIILILTKFCAIDTDICAMPTALSEKCMCGASVTALGRESKQMQSQKQCCPEKKFFRFEIVMLYHTYHTSWTTWSSSYLPAHPSNHTYRVT